MFCFVFFYKIRTTQWKKRREQWHNIWNLCQNLRISLIRRR